MLSNKLSENIKKELSNCQTIEDLARVIGSAHWFGIEECFCYEVDCESNRNPIYNEQGERIYPVK